MTASMYRRAVLEFDVSEKHFADGLKRKTPNVNSRTRNDKDNFDSSGTKYGEEDIWMETWKNGVKKGCS